MQTMRRTEAPRRLETGTRIFTRRYGKKNKEIGEDGEEETTPLF
jgi:hypothetical protein